MLHLANMNQLDELTKSLNRKMAVLDATQPTMMAPKDDGFVITESPKKQNPVNFATTIKTDNLHATVTEDLKKFRVDQQIDNPFASKNLEGGL